MPTEYTAAVKRMSTDSIRSQRYKNTYLYIYICIKKLWKNTKKEKVLTGGGKRADEEQVGETFHTTPI